jgi:phenylacetate-CoA ligase
MASARRGLAAAVAASVRDVTKLRGEVVLCAPGSLPNDGKVIEDARSYKLSAAGARPVVRAEAPDATR